MQESTSLKQDIANLLCLCYNIYIHILLNMYRSFETGEFYARCIASALPERT